MGPLFDETETHFDEEEIIFDFADGSCSSYVEHESDNVFVCSQEHRVLVASDAGAMGRLTRLAEHIVESVAIGNTTDDGRWSGIKSANQLDLRSIHIRVSMEAAALGRLHRGSEREYAVTNWDQNDENEYGPLKTDNNNEDSVISNALSKLEEAEYQVDDILQEMEALGEVDPDSIDDVLLLLISLKEHIDSLCHHLQYQPNRVSSLIDDVIKKQRDDISKSWAHHLTALEDLETYQNTKDTFDGQHLAVLPCLEEPAFVKPVHYMTKKNKREALAIQAAKVGLRRTDQLSKTNSIRIRPTCTCPYCGTPSSFQTQSYKQMRARRKANDESLKKELVGIARKRPAKRRSQRRNNSEGNNPLTRKVVARGRTRRSSMKGNFASPSQNNENGPSESWVSPRTQRRQEKEATKKNEKKEPTLLQRFGEWISPTRNKSEGNMTLDTVGSRLKKEKSCGKEENIPPPPPIRKDSWVSPLSERRKRAKKETKKLRAEKRKKVKTATPSPYALQKAKLFNISTNKNDQGRPNLQKAQGATIRAKLLFSPSEQRKRANSALKLTALFPPLSLRREQDLEITAKEELEVKLQRQRKTQRRTLIESSIVKALASFDGDLISSPVSKRHGQKKNKVASKSSSPRKEEPQQESPMSRLTRWISPPLKRMHSLNHYYCGSQDESTACSSTCSLNVDDSMIRNIPSPPLASPVEYE